MSEARIEPGMRVLDYGCGPGSYLLPAAELVGEAGRIYALDKHPLAIRSVRKLISRRRLTNVETILSGCETGLPDNEVDRVLLYDVLHCLAAPTSVLQELRPVLKPDGALSLNDHHTAEGEIVSVVTASGLFRLLRRGQRTYTFSPGQQ